MQQGENQMNLLEVMKHRASVRRYTGETIPEDTLAKILQAGLLSPSSRAKRPWEFVVVRDKETLAYLSACREQGHAKMLAGADCAIVVVADPSMSDVWTEDCSIAMFSMHLMADYLGIGSCWIQGRLRKAGDGMTTEAYIRKALQYPEKYALEAILSLGVPGTEPKPQAPDGLHKDKIHWERF